MGIPFDFHKGEGPVIESAGALRRRTSPRCGASSRARSWAWPWRPSASCDGSCRCPLIGFAGAPFTLASYAIEGGHSSHFALTKGMMYGDAPAWHRLAALLADVVADYLRAQVEAGVQAVQLFDSWIGALDEADYREFVAAPRPAHLRRDRRPRRARRSTSGRAPATCSRCSARPAGR